MEQLHNAAVFMGSTILIGLGVLFAIGFLIAANNLLYRFWKDLNWTWYRIYDSRYEFVDQQAKEELKK